MVDPRVPVHDEDTDEIIEVTIGNPLDIQEHFDALPSELWQLVEVRLSRPQGERLEFGIEGCRGCMFPLLPSSRFVDVGELCDREDPFFLIPLDKLRSDTV